MEEVERTLPTVHCILQIGRDKDGKPQDLQVSSPNEIVT